MNRQERVAAEVQLGIEAGSSIWVPTEEHLPDLRLGEDWRDVHRIETQRYEMPERRFHAMADFKDLVFAIWSREGRVLLTPEELIARADVYRKNIIAFSFEGDEFVNPFRYVGAGASPLDLAGGAVQLTLDGRQVTRMSAGRLGSRQRELLNVLAYRGSLTSTEAGILLHAIHGCPERKDRPDKQYASPYAGAGCCRKATDEGSQVMGIMARQGRVWKDGDQWLLYPEGSWNEPVMA